MKMVFIVLAVFSAVASVALANPTDPYFVGSKSTLPEEVQAVHQAYLKGKLEEVAPLMKTALMKYADDQEIQVNLLALYRIAYDQKRYSALTPDWSLPTGITWAAVSNRQTDYPKKGQRKFSLTVSFDLQNGALVERLKVTKDHGEVLIDRDEKQILEENKMHPTEFWAASDRKESPIAPGLYHLEFNLKGQPPVVGWFIIADTGAVSSFPVLDSPTSPLYEFAGEFRWQDYISSLRLKKETRSLALSILPENTDYPRRDFKEDSGVTLPTSYVPQVPFTPGKIYSFRVSYGERHKFGGLAIKRDLQTEVEFEVK